MKRSGVLLALACGGHAAEPAHVMIPPPTQSALATPPPPKPRDACDEIRAEQRAKIVAEFRARATHGEGVTEASVLAPFERGLVGGCASFEGGAWAMEFSDHALSDYDAISGEAVLVIDVHHARIRQSGAPMWVGAAGTFVSTKLALAGDYDGDGVPEVFLGSYEDGVEGGHSESGTIYTLSNGAVVTYAPIAALEKRVPGIFFRAPRDVDGDGRMDLPTNAGVDLGAETECFGKSDWTTPHFLAHALADGTFSLDDDVAKREAKKFCPAPPATLDQPADVLCARLWASTPAAFTALKKRVACVAWDCAAEISGKPQQPGAARACAARRDAIDAKPPFTLP